MVDTDRKAGTCKKLIIKEKGRLAQWQSIALTRKTIVIALSCTGKIPTFSLFFVMDLSYKNSDKRPQLKLR